MAYFIENIIIGSGPSGSITALELKKNKLDTLIIEQGYKYSLPKTKLLLLFIFYHLVDSLCLSIKLELNLVIILHA